MIKLLKRRETLMAAAAFAEEGEVETARKLMKEETLRKTARPSSSKQERISTRPTKRAD